MKRHNYVTKSQITEPAWEYRAVHPKKKSSQSGIILPLMYTFLKHPISKLALNLIE